MAAKALKIDRRGKREFPCEPTWNNNINDKERVQTHPLPPAWNNNGLILFSSRHAAPIPSPSHDGSALTPAPRLVAATLRYKPHIAMHNAVAINFAIN